jgi:hypothetical protein
VGSTNFRGRQTGTPIISLHRCCLACIRMPLMLELEVVKSVTPSYLSPGSLQPRAQPTLCIAEMNVTHVLSWPSGLRSIVITKCKRSGSTEAVPPRPALCRGQEYEYLLGPNSRPSHVNSFFSPDALQENISTFESIHNISVVSHNHNFAAVSPALLVSSFSASAALASAFSPTPDPPIFSTTPLTTSRVAAGPPGSAARTSPSFLTTKTPRVVPLGAFFSPIASMSDAEGSHSRGYGSFCLSLKVVLALGESVLKP